MAHANPYTPGQVETLEQAQNELVKLADVVNQIIANQKLLQRDDGCLADCAVVPHTLSDEVGRMIGHFELLGAYAARPYQKGQVVTYRDRMYVCVAPHQGGTVMDTAAWRLIGKAGCGCEGEAAGYARGYSEGKAAGSGGGSGGGQMTNDTLLDAQGRPIYPVIVTFTEYGKDSTGTDNGHNITSQTVVYSYQKNIKSNNNGTRDSLSVPSIKIWGGQHIVGGYIPYTFNGEYNIHVTAIWEGASP